TFEPISPIETARLLSIDVEVGQRVKVGDVIAQMDTALIDASIQVSEAEMMDTESAVAGFQRNIMQLDRQYSEAIADAEQALEELRQTQLREQAELDAWKAEEEKQTQQLRDKVITIQQVRAYGPQIAALEKALESYPALKQLYQGRIEQAKIQKMELRETLGMEDGEKFDDLIQRKMDHRNAILESMKNKQETKKEAYTLKATRPGIVSRIYKKRGDVINSGEIIVRLTSEEAEFIEGFLPETHSVALKIGEKTSIKRSMGADQVATAVVMSIAPEVQALPGRVSPIGGMQMRGRRVVLSIEGKHDLIPGESVRIYPEFSYTGRLKLGAN
ncbi:MAG: biotin/lipoyl-binding protein, partial [Verrucomicrobiota bacterium]